VGSAAIGPLVVSYPQAAPFLQFTLCSFGALLAYKQEELNDFTEWLMANKDRLAIDFDSSEFQKGVFIQMDTYFNLRLRDKRLVAQNIFRSYCGAPDMPNFPLERYNDTLVKISKEGLRYLVFLQQEVIPLRDEAIEKKYAGGNYPLPPVGESKDWWMERLKKTESISDYITHWLDNVYPQTVDVSQIDDGKEEYRHKQVEKKRNDLSELSLEMEQLGLMRSYSGSSIGWDGGDGNGASLTSYGLGFMEFIPKSNL